MLCEDEGEDKKVRVRGERKSGCCMRIRKRMRKCEMCNSGPYGEAQLFVLIVMRLI